MIKKIYINNFTTFGLKLSLASPYIIIQWCIREISKKKIIGEITEPLTIKFKGGVPEENGLFCERIFGSINSWFCKCGFYKKRINKLNILCKYCNIEFNDSKIRRYRLGFIFLNAPIIHTWYFKGFFSILSCLLNISNLKLEHIIYYKDFLLKLNKTSKYFYKQSINNIVNKNKLYLNNFNISQLIFISNFLQEILSNINILLEISLFKDLLLQSISILEHKNIIKKLNLLHIFFIGNLNPGWIFLDILPVIPPGLRPIFKLKNGIFLISPLNNIYKTIIMKNNRLKYWIKLRSILSPLFEITEKRIIQKIIDNLFLDKKKNKKFSLIKFLKGKYGRFRHNLLGKRIDFSGRSVIISGPDINFGKIGLPIELALNLFKPLLLKFLLKKFFKFNILKANLIIQQKSLNLKLILKKLLKKQIILINRAPTLHRLNIQAFKPFIIEGESIKFFPLACSSFNADFDGDQVGIFLSLSKFSKLESKTILSCDKNILSPVTGKNIYKPTQSIILGLFFLFNFICKQLRGGFLYYNNFIDLLSAFEHNIVDLQALLWLKLIIIEKFNFKYKKIKNFFLTSVGRILLHKNILVK